MFVRGMKAKELIPLTIIPLPFPSVVSTAFLGSESDVPQRQRGKGNHKHQARRHELFGFGQSHAKDHEQQGQQNVGDVRSENDSRSAQAERGGKAHRHDQRNAALAFEKTNQTADDQQDDVNPENFALVHCLVYLGRRESSVKHAQRAKEWVPSVRRPQSPWTSRLKTWPGTHSTRISIGRQHTSQSIVKR